jgi:hypothetical protein
LAFEFLIAATTSSKPSAYATKEIRKANIVCKTCFLIMQLLSKVLSIDQNHAIVQINKILVYVTLKCKKVFHAVITTFAI